MKEKKISKIAIIGDVHVGNHKKLGGEKVCGINRRCENIFTALGSAVLRARLEDVDLLVILGDLFHTPNPSPQMLKRVQDIIELVPTAVIAGNHDMSSDAEGDNALGPLSLVAEIIDKPDIISLVGVDLLMVPFQSGKCSEWLPRETKKLLKESKNKNKILCFHSGIKDEKTPYFLADSDASIDHEDLFDLCKEGNINAAFAGHWHSYKAWEYYDCDDSHSYDVIQAGAFTPTGWDNPGFEYGNLFVYDGSKSAKNKIEFHKCGGPRFITSTLDEEIKTITGYEKSENTGLYLYLRLCIDEQNIELGKSIIKAGIDSEVIENGELVISKEYTEQATKLAAEATQASKTLEEALDNFTSKMPLRGIGKPEDSAVRTSIKEKSKYYMELANVS